MADEAPVAEADEDVAAHLEADDDEAGFGWLARLVAMAMVGVPLSLLFVAAEFGFEALSDAQRARNRFLRQEVEVLDARLEEVEHLQRLRAETLERAAIIAELRDGQQSLLGALDQLRRLIPAGVRLTRVDIDGERIRVAGLVAADRHLPELLWRIAESPRFAAPSLASVSDAPEGRDASSTFVLTVSHAVEDR